MTFKTMTFKTLIILAKECGAVDMSLAEARQWLYRVISRTEGLVATGDVTRKQYAEIRETGFAQFAEREDSE